MEIHFPIIMLKTQRVIGIIDRLAKVKGVNRFSTFFLYLLPPTAAFITYLIARSLATIIESAFVRAYVKSLGIQSNFLLPGLNPYLPIVYGWIGIVVAIIVHEGAHGVIARAKGLPVNSAGLLFFLIIPVGAFVEVDEKEMEKAHPSNSMRVLAAGPGSNLVVSLFTLVLLLLLLGTMYPAYGNLLIYAVADGGPAYNAGVKGGQAIVLAVDNVNVSSIEEFEKMLSKHMPNETLVLTAYLPENRSVIEYKIRLGSRPDNVSKAYAGVLLVSLDKVLDSYRSFRVENIMSYLVWPTLSPSTIPFSDHLAPFYTSSVGSSFYAIANLLYWTWVVNFNVSVFNALPIYPLDGGQALKVFLKKVLEKKVSLTGQNIIVWIISLIMLSLLLATIIVPQIF
jgi:membrane-associated protease RseP (regulator of RpoE activity)